MAIKAKYFIQTVSYLLESTNHHTCIVFVGENKNNYSSFSACFNNRGQDLKI